MDTQIRTVKPIESPMDFSSFPMQEHFRGLVKGNCSKMFFMGQLISFWGYSEPTEIEVSSIDLDSFGEGEFTEGAEILDKTLSAIKILHFRNRTNRELQRKDFGKIIYLLEKNLSRTDRFCPKCSDIIPERFHDIYKFCGFCATKLEVQPFTPPRFRKKQAISYGESC